jgi:hypothetical protein
MLWELNSKDNDWNREVKSMDTGPYILIGMVVLALILVVGIVRWVKNNK